MWRYLILILPFFAFNGVFPFVASLVPAYYGWREFSQDRDLREQGMPVEAHITEKSKMGSTYYIKYRFIDTKGVEWKAAGELGPEYNTIVNANGDFLITYLPSNPNIHIITIGDRSSSSFQRNLALGLIGLTVLLFGWGVWGIGSTTWRLYQVRRLFEDGEVGAATVGDWIRAPGRPLDRKDQMTFHFVAVNGRWYEGRSRSFNSDIVQQWPKGSHLKVAYDPAHPTNCEPDVFQLLD